MPVSKLKHKIPICVLIGSGSKLASIIKAAGEKGSFFNLSLVVSHKVDSGGVKIALKNNIPAVYFKLPDYRKRLYGDDNKKARADYMKHLGWFITQREYAPKLLVFAGWDLVMDKNFFNFFRCDFGEGFAAINLHPAILPLEDEGNQIKLPDGSSTPIIKGEQQEVLESVLVKKLSYFGPSVHFMVADGFDTGKVIKRAFIKVGNAKTVYELRKKLMPVEDRILIESINQVVNDFIR